MEAYINIERKNKKKFIKDQIILSTKLDLQGERMPEELLRKFVEVYQGQLPIHSYHNMDSPIEGYISNFRLVQDPEDESELVVIADVVLDHGDKWESGAFSFSWIEIYKTNSSSPKACMFLPYPYYNNAEYIEYILDNTVDIAVGKWYKKTLDPDKIILIASTLLLQILNPIYLDIYKAYIRPQLLIALEKCKRFKKDGFYFDYAQQVEVNGKTIALYFVPNRKNNLKTIEPDAILLGIKLVRDYLIQNTQSIAEIEKVFLFWNNRLDRYEIDRIQFANGEIELLSV